MPAISIPDSQRIHEISAKDRSLILAGTFDNSKVNVSLERSSAAITESKGTSTILVRPGEFHHGVKSN